MEAEGHSDSWIQLFAHLCSSAIPQKMKFYKGSNLEI
jgi:hypothetical protein